MKERRRSPPKRQATPEPVERPMPKKQPPILFEEDTRPILGYWDIRGLA